MSVDFDQSFQIFNISCSKMIDKNIKITDILVSHFWVGDHHMDLNSSTNLPLVQPTEPVCGPTTSPRVPANESA
jgi:hypothetical protein